MRYYRQYTSGPVLLTRNGTYIFELADKVKQYTLPNSIVDTDEEREVSISCTTLNKETEEVNDYASNGPSLDKGLSLIFTIDHINVPGPRKIRWLVQNAPGEAYEHLSEHGPEHDTLNGNTRVEGTAYTGCHNMYCQILQDNKVVARCRYDVNIK